MAAAVVVVVVGVGVCCLYFRRGRKENQRFCPSGGRGAEVLSGAREKQGRQTGILSKVGG